MVNSTVFEAIGLSEKETILYQTCLQLGKTTIGQIAQKSGIQRTHCYDIAEKLIQKGILKQTSKEKRQYLIATAPEEVLEMHDKKLQNLRDHLPELSALMNTSSKKPAIYYYEGENGLETISDEANLCGGELLVFTDETFFHKHAGMYEKHHVEKRIKSKTKCRTLVGMSSNALQSKQMDSEALRETRLLPKQLFDAKAMIGIYKNRTFVLNYKKKFGYVIDDSEFTETLRMIFELLWTSGKIV